MRQRSITGPLILVAIGILFLLNNLVPGFSFPRLLADYWPFLLILFGVIGLVEVLFHLGRGTTPPPRPMAGPWIFWIVVISVLVGVVSSSRHGIHIGRIDAGGVGILGSDYDYNVNATGAPEGVNRIVLDNVRGNISLKGEDGGGIRVSGRKTVRAFNRRAADKANEQTHIRMDRQGDLLVIRPADQSDSRTLQITTDLDITAPKHVSIEARGRSGDLTVENIDGGVDVSSGRGDIRLNDIAKDVKIETSRSGLIRVSNLKGGLDIEGRGGDIQLENIAGQVIVNGEYSGTMEFRGLAKPLHFESSHTDFRVESIPGSVTLDLGELKMVHVVGPVRFQTRSRDIQVEDVTNSLELNVDRGDIQITPASSPLPKMDVHSRNGNIDLTLPEKAAFELKGTTSQGEVENEYGPPLETQSDGRSATIKGSIGRGPQINVTTDRGKLSIKKS